MRTLLLLLTLAASCQAPHEPSVLAPPTDLSTWTSESIQFPPSFAPSMPAGSEELLFAPGWRVADAEDHWAYALLMQLQEPSLDAPRIAALLDLYFDGLIGSVGSNNKPFTLPADPARVSISSAGSGQFTGTIQTFDAFGDGAPLTLWFRLAVEAQAPNSTVLRIQVCRQPLGESRVWDELQSAIDSLSFD